MTPNDIWKNENHSADYRASIIVVITELITIRIKLPNKVAPHR